MIGLDIDSFSLVISPLCIASNHVERFIARPRFTKKDGKNPLLWVGRRFAECLFFCVLQELRPVRLSWAKSNKRGFGNMASMSHAGKRKWRLSGACVLVLVLTGCGGSSHDAGNGSTSSPPPSSGDTAPLSFTIGGAVSGLLAGTKLTLSNNGGDPLVISSNGAFTFSTPVAVNGNFAVTVQTQPGGQNCTVTDGTLVQVRSNITNVTVNCTSSPEFVYVANNGDGTVSQYEVGVGGALTALNPAAVPAGFATSGITVDPLSRYAYVLNNGGFSISQYSISSDGTLAALNPATLVLTDTPLSETVDPSGRFVYVAVGGTSINQYAIGSAGMLTALSPATVAAPFLSTLAVDPSGRFAYATDVANNAVLQYAIDPSGSLTPVNTAVPTGTNPTSIAIDPSDRFVYTGNHNGNTISQYAVGANGTLSALSPATVATGGDPVAIVIDASSRFAYVPNFTDNTVSQYAIGADGTLSLVATVPAGAAPRSIALDSSGRFAYVGNQGNSTISQYAVAADGALTPLTPATVSTGSAPTAIGVATIRP